MTEIQNTKTYDLEDRTLTFAKNVYGYVRDLPKDTANIETGKQLVRSAGSIGANYREANEALGKKDFLMRIRISRKEAKETIFWLELSEPLKEKEKLKAELLDEANQLMKICGAILEKSQV